MVCCVACICASFAPSPSQLCETHWYVGTICGCRAAAWSRLRPWTCVQAARSSMRTRPGHGAVRSCVGLAHQKLSLFSGSRVGTGGARRTSAKVQTLVDAERTALMRRRSTCVPVAVSTGKLRGFSIGGRCWGGIVHGRIGVGGNLPKIGAQSQERLVSALVRVPTWGRIRRARLELLRGLASDPNHNDGLV